MPPLAVRWMGWLGWMAVSAVVWGLIFLWDGAKRAWLPPAVVHTYSTNINRKLPYTTHTYYTLVDIHMQHVSTSSSVSTGSS